MDELLPLSPCGFLFGSSEALSMPSRIESPRMRLARSMSRFMRVTRRACRQHRLASSSREVTKASDDSWRARRACDWKRKSESRLLQMSRTTRWKGARGMSRWVDFWRRRISRSAMVPGLKRCFLYTACFDFETWFYALGCCAISFDCFAVSLAFGISEFSIDY